MGICPGIRGDYSLGLELGSITMSIITLTTDFGESSPYVAIMKGVILGIDPTAQIIDLSHQIVPQDIHQANYFLVSAIPYFPKNTIHIAVIDPGVGTQRKPIAVSIDDRYLIGPDNGIFSGIIQQGKQVQIWELNNSAYWRSQLSSTFHGRDIFAPIAAHLSRGIRIEELGIVKTDWIVLEPPKPENGLNEIRGQVTTIDHFGNLITNIAYSQDKQPPNILVLNDKDYRKRFQWVRTYGEALSGELVVLISSDGFLEIAIVNGNAAKELNVSRGSSIRIGFLSGA
jgi:S-adenosyl-L-methionine hydrolase (adenosine-forming)